MYKNAKGMKKSLFILIGVLTSLTVFSQENIYVDSVTNLKYQYYLDTIEAVEAWDYVHSHNHSRVLVAVIDTGIDLHNTDFVELVCDFLGAGRAYSNDAFSYSNLSGKPTIPVAGNISDTTSTGYAIAGDVATALADKQATLVSGTNIKTVNNTSLLGSGNIDVTISVATTSTAGSTTLTSATGIDIYANPSNYEVGADGAPIMLTASQIKAMIDKAIQESGGGGGETMITKVDTTMTDINLNLIAESTLAIDPINNP